MTGWWFMVRRTYLFTHTILWQSGDMWSRDKIKSVTYPFWQDQWLWKLVNWWLMKNTDPSSYTFFTRSHITCHMSFTKSQVTRSRDKLKAEYFLLQKTYGTNRCRMLTYGEAKPIIKLHKSDHIITRGIRARLKT